MAEGQHTNVATATGTINSTVIVATDSANYFSGNLPRVQIELLFAVLYFRFWLRLPPHTRVLFMFAGLVYVGGAFVIEGLSAAYWDSAGGLSYPYLMIATLEEFCEMAGVIILIYALLSHIVDEQYDVAFLSDRADVPPQRGFKARPLIIIAISLAVIVNIGVIAWALAVSGGRQSSDPTGQYIYGSLIDQLAVNGVIVTRESGRFGLAGPSADTVVALAEAFPTITVINLFSSDSYLVLAGGTLPFTRNDLIEILHSNKETQFIIFGDAAARLLLQAEPPE